MVFMITTAPAAISIHMLITFRTMFDFTAMIMFSPASHWFKRKSSPHCRGAANSFMTMPVSGVTGMGPGRSLVLHQRQVLMVMSPVR